MTNSTDNLVLEHLRAIRGTLDRHTQDLHEIKGRIGLLEEQYAGLSRRVDRIDERVGRIETRLDLQDA